MTTDTDPTTATVNGWTVRTSRIPPGRFVTGYQYELIAPDGTIGASGLGGMTPDSALRRGTEMAESSLPGDYHLPPDLYWYHLQVVAALHHFGDLKAIAVADVTRSLGIDTLKWAGDLERAGLVEIIPDQYPELRLTDLGQRIGGWADRTYGRKEWA
jgi:hypothetical protein